MVFRDDFDDYEDDIFSAYGIDDIDEEFNDDDLAQFADGEDEDDEEEVEPEGGYELEEDEE